MSPRPPPRFDPLIHPDIVDNIIPYLLLIDYNPRFLARAALVCKSWNTLYTPFLWRNIKVDNNNFATVPESLQGYGVYVRQLTVSFLTEAMFDIITAVCPFVRSVTFSCPEVSVERLVLYLSTLKATLTTVSLGMMTVPPEGIVSALVDDAGGGGGGGGYSKLKTWILKLDPAVWYTKSLCWDSLVRLMEAHAHLERFRLANIHVFDPVITGNHNQDQDHQTATTEEVKDTGHCHALLNPRPLDQQHTTTTITLLNFSRVEMNDRMMIDLLGKTPQLTSLCIARNKTVKGDFLVALPMLCPEVRKLVVGHCGLIPPSAFSRFFQSLAVGSHNNQPQQQLQQDRASLQLERLHLVRCKLEDRSLEHLASSQASTLLYLHIRKCSGVTDSGLKAVLRRCHRLESLALMEIVGPTLAIMTDDTDVNNNNDTDFGATLLTTDQEERQKWACYKTLKRLDIRNLGLQHPRDFFEAEDLQNRAAFRRIRQRIRMLPALEQLAVCVCGAEEELLQGFMGVEEEDQGHLARQLTIGEKGEGEVVNENANQTDAEATAAVPTPTTDSAASGGAESPHHHLHQHNSQEARTLVGPRLRILKIRGEEGSTFLGSDLDRFMRNYPGLRELNTLTAVLNKEAVDRLREAGIEALS